MSAKKILLVGFIFVLLAAIPLTVYLVQQEQKTKSGAQVATTLSIDPTPKTINVTDNFANDVFNLAVKVNPGSINQVSFVKFTITYDTTYLATVSAGTKCSNATYVNDAFCPNTTKFPNVMQGPTYTNGTISITLSVGNNPDNAIKNLESAGTIYFKALAPTSGTTVDLPQSNAQVLSIGSNDQFNENVALKPVPGVVIITVGSQTITNTPTPTTAAAGPNCTSLTISPATNGTAPYAVNLTANGQDSSATISKLTFNFGDGQTQDVTNSSGIGTNSISVLQSHTYSTAGNYTATAVLTDASGNVSPIGNCSVAIVVNNGTTNTNNGTATTTAVENNTPAVVTATPTITATPLQNEQTGPKEIITVGSIGAVITVIGAVLLLAL